MALRWAADIFDTWTRDARSGHLVLLSICVLALIVRCLGARFLTSDTHLSPDETLYVRLADNLLSTRTFGAEPGVPSITVAPVYPLLVTAVFRIAGHNLLAVRFVQAVIGTATCAVMFRLTRELFPKRNLIAWLTLLAMAFYPVFVLWNNRILTESIYLFIITLCWWGWVKSLKTPTIPTAALTAIGLCLSVLTRETLLFFIPVILIGTKSSASWKQFGRYVLVFVVAFLITITPLAMRNYILFGYPFFEDLGAFLSHNLTDAYVSPSKDKYDVEPSQLAAELQSLNMNDLAYTPTRYLYDLTFLREHSVLYARIITARLFELWGHPIGLNRLPSTLQPLYRVVHLTILSLAVVGFALVWRMRNRRMVWLCTVVPYVTVVRIYTRPYPRYTLPFLPLVFVLVAVAMERLMRVVIRTADAPRTNHLPGS